VRLVKLEERLSEVSATYVDVQNQIWDIKFVIQQYQRELIEKIHEAKTNVISLVGIRKFDCDIIDNFARELALIQVKITEVDNPQTLGGLHPRCKRQSL
jgi:hypothetical protein